MMMMMMESKLSEALYFNHKILYEVKSSVKPHNKTVWTQDVIILSIIKIEI